MADHIHKFEDAVVFVTPNACFAIASNDGTYSIDEIPPGTYTVKVYTRPKRTDLPEAQVRVTSGKTTAQEFTLER